MGDRSPRIGLRLLRWTACLGYALFIALCLGGCFKSQTVDLLVFPLTTGGTIAALASSSLALASKKTLVGADVVRVAAWTALGVGVAAATCTGYYRYFEPQLGQVTAWIGAGTIAVSLLTIVASSAKCPRWMHKQQ